MVAEAASRHLTAGLMLENEDGSAAAGIWGFAFHVPWVQTISSKGRNSSRPNKMYLLLAANPTPGLPRRKSQFMAREINIFAIDLHILASATIFTTLFESAQSFAIDLKYLDVVLGAIQFVVVTTDRAGLAIDAFPVPVDAANNASRAGIYELSSQRSLLLFHPLECRFAVALSQAFPSGLKGSGAPGLTLPGIPTRA